MIHSYETPRESGIQKQKVDEKLPGPGERRHRELILNGYRVSILGDEKVLEKIAKFYAMLLPHMHPPQKKKKKISQVDTGRTASYHPPSTPTHSFALNSSLDSSGI